LGRDLPEGLIFHKPLGFIDYVRLQQDSLCVLSDSGTISEESSVLGFPAVTLRDSIERPEALDTGSIIMTGLDPANVVEAVDIVVRDQSAGKHVPADYAIDNCSERAVRFILSTHRRHRAWSGIRG
jgi:UDP-N-acetylglucosamine 2-epimerase (non-hydrolysing)